MFTAIRYHDISCGHRVVGHEGKCQFLHGHNYRFHFFCQAAKTDEVGRVIDFGVIKATLCEWLEKNWDHKLLLWIDDPMCTTFEDLRETYVAVPFNPTAENMARYMVEEIGPVLLGMYAVRLVRVTVEETAKCSATYEVNK
jgi:6-pyruvoyltetrahydropterin/6-carboxytetrahydropterin synthase